MNVVLTANRTEFSLGEKASQRDRSDHFLDGPGIVIGLWKQSGSPAIAAEEQCRLRWVRVRIPIPSKQLYEVLVGRIGVTDMELHRLADAHQIPDRNHAVG